MHMAGQKGYKAPPWDIGGPLCPISCGWSPPEPMKHGHRLIQTVESMAAVYRVELGRPGALSAWYVGETRGFKGRMGQYGVMIRRLLAMYATTDPVVIDQDRFRLVQYEFARSIVNGEHIHWRWRYLPDGADTKNAEDQEIALAKVQFPGVRTLNRKHSGLSYGYFDDMPVNDVDLSWRQVHARLVSHKASKNLGSRCMVV